MKAFEYISASHGFQESLSIQPNREALWAKAFGVDSLDGMFDMTPVEKAIPLFDAAIRKFNSDPEELRPFLAADDPIGLRGNRGALVKLRKHMDLLGGTISGAVDEA
ncbi:MULTISPECIES: hypothetical protein [Nocardia]|uniref:Uncharacterized protein n=1 Tax=Nocardia nova TaxID=37330 RepID=A0A2T2Z8D1_9NOCA|nr:MULTISPECIES: hypothetical protein [Nocardia]PSR64010.1 hypothetical protein C8259_09190 [Nocardia nova]